jgi:hypothetical protein
MRMNGVFIKNQEKKRMWTYETKDVAIPDISLKIVMTLTQPYQRVSPSMDH